MEYKSKELENKSVEKTEVEEYKQKIKDAYLVDFMPHELYKYASTNNSSDIAHLINMNLGHIKENDALLFNLYKKIKTKEEMYKDLLTYELINSDIEDKNKISKLDRLIKFTKNEFKKYQGIVGGYHIEDMEWGFCNRKRFKLKNTQHALFNTIGIKYISNDNDLDFLDNFKNHIRKYISSSLSVKVYYKIINDNSNKIGWILFIFEKETE